MKSLSCTNVFLPDKLPEVESIGIRADRGTVRLWMINKDAVVVAELLMSPEDGWELAKDIVSVSDKAAGV